MSTHPATQNFVCRSCGSTAIPHVCKGLHTNMTGHSTDRPVVPRIKQSPSLEEIRKIIEARIEFWAEDVHEGDPEEYAFDAGYIAGLRWVVNKLAEKPESL